MKVPVCQYTRNSYRVSQSSLANQMDVSRSDSLFTSTSREVRQEWESGKAECLIGTTANQAKRAYAGEFRPDLINPQLPPKLNVSFFFWLRFRPKRKVVSSQMAFAIFGYMKWVYNTNQHLPPLFSHHP